jgi:hypothetical protein
LLGYLDCHALSTGIYGYRAETGRTRVARYEKIDVSVELIGDENPGVKGVRIPTTTLRIVYEDCAGSSPTWKKETGRRGGKLETSLDN